VAEQAAGWVTELKSADAPEQAAFADWLMESRGMSRSFCSPRHCTKNWTGLIRIARSTFVISSTRRL